MSIISTVPKGAAVEGINENLLDNWYFEVNQRNFPDSGTVSAAVFARDRWHLARCSYTFNNNGSVTYARTESAYAAFLLQYTSKSLYDSTVGKKATLSAFVNGSLYSLTFTLPTGNGNDYTLGGGISIHINTVHAVNPERGYEFQFKHDNYSGLTFGPVKLELGDTQTLAHQENGVWVLNSAANYWSELAKCQLNYAEWEDEYSDQRIGNITVQCNSVGSSSLRYYNKLIRPTHKVLDSIFSNPAAQTSDITVTTYDGYLDFSNGFASGATTNITLVLGTSGPVLSTSTTAPS